MPATSVRHPTLVGCERQTPARARFTALGWTELRFEPEETAKSVDCDTWSGMVLSRTESRAASAAPLVPLHPATSLRIQNRPNPLQLNFVADLIQLRTQLGTLTQRVGQLSTDITRTRKLTASMADHYQHSEAQLVETYTNLAKLAKLERDWDSYDARPPSTIAIGTAMQLIGKVYLRFRREQSGSMLPYAVSPFSGGVQIEWRANDMALQIDIEADGTLGGVVEDASTGVSVYKEYDSLDNENVLSLAQRVLGARVPA